MQKEVLFITGGNGFLGKRLLQKYLSLEIEIYLLIQEKFVPSMEEFFAKNRGQAKVRLVRGDITFPNLGMDPSLAREIREKATTVLHLAAAYDLKLAREVGWKVNVEGTENLLNFIEGMPHLKRFGYLSTTAISGTYRGFFREEDFDVGQKFKNFYEETKFEAEKRVRGRMGRIPTTIFRPTIIVGDSRTGEMEKIDGPYHAFVMLKRKMHLVIQKSSARCNLEPVDFVINGIFALMQNPSAAGKTLHLADPAPLTYDAFFDLLIARWGTFKPLFRIPAWVLYPLLWIPGVSKIMGVPRQSFVYTMTPVEYGTRETTRLLESVGIACPPVDSYLDNLIHYFRSHYSEIKSGPARW